MLHPGRAGAARGPGPGRSGALGRLDHAELLQRLDALRDGHADVDLHVLGADEAVAVGVERGAREQDLARGEPEVEAGEGLAELDVRERAYGGKRGRG